MLRFYWKSLLANHTIPGKFHLFLRLQQEDFLYSSLTFSMLVQVAFEYQVFVVPSIIAHAGKKRLIAQLAENATTLKLKCDIFGDF